MFVNKNALKKLSLITLSCLIFLTSMNTKSEIEYAQIGKDIAHCYGIFLLGTLVHELGHWLAGKIIHKCNGYFYITPLGNGGTCFYYNPTKEVIKARWNNEEDYLLIKPVLHPLVHAAGPLFGIGFSALVPIANTFYHEYKLDKSILNALAKIAQQPYFNNKQNSGILHGALASFGGNIFNLLPFDAGNDGNKILKYFNVQCPTNRLVHYALAIAVSALCNLKLINR